MNNSLQVRNFNHEQFGEIRTVYNNGNDDIWFVGKDIAETLGYKRATKAIQDHVDLEDKDEIPIEDSIGRMQKTPIINIKGVMSLINSCQILTAEDKLNTLKIFTLEDYIMVKSRPKIEFGEQLEIYMRELDYTVEKQYKVLGYYIDFYIPELNIAIEYDEEQHKHSYEEDKQREIEIQEEIGCKFIRIDDGLNIGTQLGMIMKYIVEER